MYTKYRIIGKITSHRLRRNQHGQRIIGTEVAWSLEDVMDTTVKGMTVIILVFGHQMEILHSKRQQLDYLYLLEIFSTSQGNRIYGLCHNQHTHHQICRVREGINVLGDKERKSMLCCLVARSISARHATGWTSHP